MNYVGITIGPIFKTIQEANTPIGLWFGSTFFSYLTRTLCSELIKLDGVEIFSPYFDPTDLQDDGVGLYHDRILLSVDTFSSGKLDDLIQCSKRQMVAYFPDQGQWPIEASSIEDFLAAYLKVDYVILTEEELQGKNVVFELNAALDCLELMPSRAVKGTENAFSRLFVGKKDQRNIYLKSSGLYELVKYQEKHLTKLKGSKRELKSLKDLSLDYEGDLAKPLSYFAVVYSDGDKVGKLLKSMCEADDGQLLDGPNQVSNAQRFSKACLHYAKKASDKVHEYDGMTIYAGGDDLLFLAPVERVLDLCYELKALFVRTLSADLGYTEYDMRSRGVSLSFGVGIYYYKYPLYEALLSASELLYQAKGLGGNQVSLRLTKHSGQSLEMALHNNDIPVVDKLIRYKDDIEQILHSVLFKLRELPVVFALLFEKGMAQPLDKEGVTNRFMNQFDNVGQKDYQEYIRHVLSLFYDTYLAKSASHQLPTGEAAVDMLINILTLLRFWQGGEE